MFVFFSLSAGKRSVYLLPLYPPLALLLGDWVWRQGKAAGWRLILYRSLVGVSVLSGIILMITSLGAIWNHEPGWFFGLIAGLLRPKDRANLLIIENALDTFGAVFTAVSILMAVFWFALGRALWLGKIRAAALVLVGIAVGFGFVGRGIVMPVIAADKSYREFVAEVKQRMQPAERVYLFGEFNSDPVIFYYGQMIDSLEQPVAQVASEVGKGEDYLIMPSQTWQEIEKLRPGLAPPLLLSAGKGPEGDAPLVLVRAQVA